MSKERPDHHDAQLVIEVYNLRREGVMRQARGAITQQFWPTTFEDVLAVTSFTHPLNAAWRQVASYWEMVYNMARHGIVNADYFVESNAEGFLLFAKVEPFLKQIRDQISPTAFRNAEWAATETAAGREIIVRFRSRIEATRKAMLAAASAAKAKPRPARAAVASAKKSAKPVKKARKR